MNYSIYVCAKFSDGFVYEDKKYGFYICFDELIKKHGSIIFLEISD